MRDTEEGSCSRSPSLTLEFKVFATTMYCLSDEHWDRPKIESKDGSVSPRVTKPSQELSSAQGLSSKGHFCCESLSV